MPQPELPPEILQQIIASWDAKKPLPNNCEPYWSALTWAQRKEIRHNYEFENDDC